MFNFVHHHPGPPNLLFQPFNTPLPLHTFLYHNLSLLLEAFNMPSSSSSYPYLPSNTQPSTSAKTSFHQAHAESNKGLKGKSKSGSYKHSFKREGQSEKPSPDIDSDSTLTSAQLSRLEAAGLARSNFCSYFDFNREWTWPQVDDMLHGEFPQLFEVLNTQTKVANANYNMRGMVGRQYKSLPPYLLCLCSHREIVVAGGVEFPDGELLFQKVRAGKRPSRDESEIIFVTHDEIPLKLIAQWIKKQNLKGKGKHRAETDSSAEDTESQPVWPKSDSGDNVDDPILSPISHSLKRCHIDAHDSDTEQAGPSHTGLLQHETIDLTGGLMDDVTSDGAEDSSLLPDAQALTLPSTPTQTMTLPAPSSSFTIDTSLANPWKVIVCHSKTDRPPTAAAGSSSTKAVVIAEETLLVTGSFGWAAFALGLHMQPPPIRSDGTPGGFVMGDTRNLKQRGIITYSGLPVAHHECDGESYFVSSSFLPSITASQRTSFRPSGLVVRWLQTPYWAGAVPDGTFDLKSLDKKFRRNRPVTREQARWRLAKRLSSKKRTASGDVDQSSETLFGLTQIILGITSMLLSSLPLACAHVADNWEAEPNKIRAMRHGVHIGIYIFLL
ncbi:hypothetical protein EDC04DRAFT_2605611 [Pisolithus marmoratus]|nr:hypothetical protein EDC04DRAFT_2605611 [Pisolithus marmoratus]